MKNIFSFLFLITFLLGSTGSTAGKIVQGDTYKSLDLSKIWMAFPLTTNKVLLSSGTGTITPSSVTNTELGYLSGVTSSIQTQFTNKQDASTAVTLTGTQNISNKTAVAMKFDYLTGVQQATPSNPAAGSNSLYFKSDNLLYSLTSGGTETAIGIGFVNPMTTGGDLIYGGSSGTPTRLANGSAGSILRSAGTTLAPTWTTATFPSTTTINQILYSSAANTVTGLATATTGVLATDSSGVPSIVQGTVANRILRTTGSAISFSTVGLSTDVAGTLPIANGGTNNGALAVTAGGVIYSDGTKLVNVGAGASGEYLKSNGASAPTWNSVTAANTGLIARYVYTNSGSPHTYTKNVNARYILVTVVAGGGAGGGSFATTSAQTSVGSGGAGGGTSFKTILNTSIGSTETVTVGAGGTGVSGSNGNAGGSSSFGAHATATGGFGGGYASASSGARIAGPSSSGVGSSGDINLRGGNGTYGFSSAQANVIGVSGAGGGSYFGQGATGIAGVIGTPSTDGASSTVYGTGGGGAFCGQSVAAATGGDGFQGIVIVEEYY